MRLQSILILTSLALCSCVFTNDDNNGTPVVNTTLKANGGKQLPEHLRNMNEGEFSEEKMLANIGTNVIAKNVEEFALQANLLKNRVERYCEDINGGIESPASEKAAQDQWEVAMLAFHVMDAASIGPAEKIGDEEVITGPLSENIYSWPFFNFCGVDQEVQKYTQGTPINKKMSSNRKGLAALEYVLFEKTLDTQCSLKAMPKMAEWVAQTTLKKKQDRCALAQFYAEDIVSKAELLNEAWDPTRENYTVSLVDNTEYKSVTAAVNAMSDALFSLETLKDKKLGAAINVSAESCGEVKCMDRVEHKWSGLSLKAMAASIQGFKEAFYGANNSTVKAFGFDDYLISKGHPELVQEMEQMINKAINKVNTLDAEGTFFDQLTAADTGGCDGQKMTSQPLCSLYDDVRAVTTAHKTDILTILSLKAPATFQGDND